MFDNGEEMVLEKLPEVVKKYQNELNFVNENVNYNRNINNYDLNTHGNGSSNSKVRVLTPSKNSGIRQTISRADNYDNQYNDDRIYYGRNSDFNQGINNQHGTSFILVMAASLALCLLVYVVTTAILRMLNF